MMRKRLICAMMALVLLFSATPASAAAATGNKRSTVFTGRTMLPTINVVVPGSGATLINPLSLPVTIGDSQSSEQIISPPACIANMSEVAVSVHVATRGNIKSGSTMKLASAPTNGNGTVKGAFLYFEMKQSDSDDPDSVVWSNGYDASQHILIGTNVTKKNDVMTLPAKTAEGKVAPGGYAHYRVAGDAVRNPTTAWNSNDGVTVQVAFTFSPIPIS